MDFILDKIETKVELFEAWDLAVLERIIGEAVDRNKALMLDVHSISHQAVYHPQRNGMLYTAAVHFKLK
ncbi:YrzA family protein [Paenibacillus sp. S-38]|uniref:YrzA family protein n=1 Tax=Paenibacillus sp. S-38 TaxID=3416710 RepID=UPI003CE6861A